MIYRIAFAALISLVLWLDVKADNNIKSTAAVKATARPSNDCGDRK